MLQIYLDRSCAPLIRMNERSRTVRQEESIEKTMSPINQVLSLGLSYLTHGLAAPRQGASEGLQVMRGPIIEGSNRTRRGLYDFPPPLDLSNLQHLVAGGQVFRVTLRSLTRRHDQDGRRGEEQL